MSQIAGHSKVDPGVVDVDVEQELHDGRAHEYDDSANNRGVARSRNKASVVRIPQGFPQGKMVRGTYTTHGRLVQPTNGVKARV